MNIKIFLERLQITPKVRDSGKWQVASGKWQAQGVPASKKLNLVRMTCSSSPLVLKVTSRQQCSVFFGGGHASISCRESHDGVGISMGKMML
jgi:hypothetical protein